MDDSEYAAVLRRTMSDLPRTFRRPAPLDELLAGVTAAAVDLIEGADCADILLIWDSTDFQSHAPTRQVATDVDDIQQRLREGPCLDATDGDALVQCDDLHEDLRWPRFAKGAIELGVHAMMSFQLYTHDNRKGALNLFGLRPHVFTAKDQTVGAMLATHAATALIAHDRERQFQAALSSRDIIGQAKGMIMERFAVERQRHASPDPSRQDARCPAASPRSPNAQPQW